MPQIGPKLQYNGGKWRQKAAISRGASCKFVSCRKCAICHLLTILCFAHDRLMLRIGPNLRSCGGESLPRKHAATNREFGDCRAALWLHGGWRAALLSRYLRIMATKTGGRPFVPVSADYDDHGRPLAPLWGWRAAFCPGICGLWRPWPLSGSITGLEGGLSPICGHYDDHGRPLAPLWGWRAAFCPGI